ncbi:conjugal transfer protein TraF [Burkholderia ubonensis]|uniref:conjugal transfer protein TraF n=1 Tax=Burkholderia ubonensis TaxID=101571 RepID=UPI0009B3065B|nr:conjugal transfer protein TraF [Burkholderia ubonensis]
MHKLNKLLPILALLMASVVPTFARAQDVPATPGEELHKSPAKQGWFWYLDPKEEKKKDLPAPVEVAPAPVEQPKPTAPIVVVPKAPKKELTPEEKEKLCKVKDTWEKGCGFVDPGDDFEFQAKQRDILLQMMSLTPDNPDSVEQAQRYMKWVVGKASMAANMWYFNMVQNPDLDPTVKNPISEVGIALATRITQASQYEYFRLIKEEGGVLFYFSRSDCAYCFDQAPYAARVARTMGLDIVNIPLDGKCLPDFTGLACGDNVKPEQAAVLDVKIVPALYLYVPSNTWIRLGTGVMTDQTILANTVNFFSAYRAAMLQGLDNSKGARPSVTFDPQYNEKHTGAAPADGSTLPGGLDRNKMMELLGYDKGGIKKAN